MNARGLESKADGDGWFSFVVDVAGDVAGVGAEGQQPAIVERLEIAGVEQLLAPIPGTVLLEVSPMLPVPPGATVRFRLCTPAPRAWLVLALLLLAFVVGCSGSTFDVASDDAQPLDDAGQLEVLDDAGQLEVLDDAGQLEVLDAATDVAPDAPSTRETFDLPNEAATGTCHGMTGAPASLGFNCRDKGDGLEQLVPRTLEVKRVTVALRIDDQTKGCAVGASHAFDVAIDSVTVGSLSFVTAPAPAGAVTLKGTFDVAPHVPATGKLRASITLRESVCFPGGAFAWLSGGTLEVQ